jgi:hypothetical protein
MEIAGCSERRANPPGLGVSALAARSLGSFVETELSGGARLGLIRESGGVLIVIVWTLPRFSPLTLPGRRFIIAKSVSIFHVWRIPPSERAHL